MSPKLIAARFVLAAHAGAAWPPEAKTGGLAMRFGNTMESVMISPRALLFCSTHYNPWFLKSIHASTSHVLMATGTAKGSTRRTLRGEPPSLAEPPPADA